jgi:hypothetical protein
VRCCYDRRSGCVWSCYWHQRGLCCWESPDSLPSSPEKQWWRNRNSTFLYSTNRAIILFHSPVHSKHVHRNGKPVLQSACSFAMSAGAVNFRGTRGPTVGSERRRETMQSAVWSLMQLVQVADWLMVQCFARSLVSTLDNQTNPSAGWLCKMKLTWRLLQMHPEFPFDAVFCRCFRYFFIVYCNRLLFSILRNFFHLFNLSFFSFLNSCSAIPNI